MSDFKGLPPDFFKFFKELSANNNREWFTANKPRYQDVVVGSLSDFIIDMAPRLAKISEHYNADPRSNGGSMFRIYRDVRFSKDKRPYKEHGAVQFRHLRGKDAHAPGFYVHFEPGNVVFGGGIWKPPAPELLKIRTAIAKDPAGWSRVRNNKALNDLTDGVMGDGITRPPKGFSGDEKHIEDIKRQTFFAMRHEKDAITRSPDFPAEVARTFKAVTPLMKFICKALDVPF